MEMRADEFVELLRRERALAILRTHLEDRAAPAMEAAVRGGFRILEFTLNSPGALERIAEFSRRPGLVVGAGTVLEPDEARAALDAGASFLVSPVLDEGVVRIAVDAGVAMIPGTQTPTEMLRAHRAGALLQKLFPAPGRGPAFVRACLGPLPFLRLVPTNDIDADNAADYLRSGAFAVGCGNLLFDPADLGARRFSAVERRAAALLSAVRAA